MRLPAVVAMTVVVVMVIPAFADEVPWYKERGTLITLKSSGFVLKARVPRGWSTKDNEVLPPAAFGSACSVSGAFYRDREWNHFLASALDPANVARDSREERTVFRIGSHAAVSRLYTIDGKRIESIYINLSDLAPDSAALWTFTGENTREGLDCALQFIAIINGAAITLE